MNSFELDERCALMREHIREVTRAAAREAVKWALSQPHPEDRLTVVGQRRDERKDHEVPHNNRP
jgi:hypothetical protein